MSGLDMPVPVPSEETKPFWEAAKSDKLVMPRCKQCGHRWFPPSLACEACGSDDFEWADVSGRGTVFTFAVYHRLYHPAFKSKLPYVVAVIQLDEGPRLISNVVNIPPEDVRCDMPVKVVFDLRRDGVKVPQFEPSAP